MLLITLNKFLHTCMQTLI